MSSGPSEVRQFFDNAAASYRSKYHHDRPWHRYFFSERLEAALSVQTLDNTRVLDIGAGTGDLYDAVTARFRNVEFHGCDLSAEMLAQSHIPQSNRHVGNVTELDFEKRHFDAIFMLGVTTYMTDDELNHTFDKVKEWLSDNGTFIVTFTNRAAFDWKMRRMLRGIVRFFSRGKRVLGSLRVSPRTHADAIALLNNSFEVEKTIWLNHTVFPFYLPFPRWSVSRAMRKHTTIQLSPARERCSSDFMLVLKRTRAAVNG
ncbi:MAG: class I SAM-dependent methyltransferase [Flavobacteriales bacterium]|nr:class I SAM-dependent methyltransferase [Flavobacteriales bacterium]